MGGVGGGGSGMPLRELTLELRAGAWAGKELSGQRAACASVSKDQNEAGSDFLEAKHLGCDFPE